MIETHDRFGSRMGNYYTSALDAVEFLVGLFVLCTLLFSIDQSTRLSNECSSYFVIHNLCSMHRSYCELVDRPVTKWLMGVSALIVPTIAGTIILEVRLVEAFPWNTSLQVEPWKTTNEKNVMESQTGTRTYISVT